MMCGAVAAILQSLKKMKPEVKALNEEGAWKCRKSQGNLANIVEIIHQPWLLIKHQYSHDFSHCKPDEFVKMLYLSQLFTGTNLLSSKTNI